MYEHGLMGPVIALVLWSLAVLVWLYVKRLPAMSKAGITPDKAQDKAVLNTLPLDVQAVANNWGHLMEQPTIFYATCFALHVIDQTGEVNIGLAWAYVALRVLHSLIQNTANVIMARFLVFALSSVVLAVLAVRAALAMWG